MKIGILTSGGDCAGLNAVMYGFVKVLAAKEQGVEIYGIAGGYQGLINGNFRKMKPEEFYGIQRLGGTVLGSTRSQYKKLITPEESNKVAAMKENYRKMGLDALVVLGGRGSHRVAGLLASEGLKIIGIPKTIDNDIFGTEVTFGFHSAVFVATDCVDRIHTTAASHGRVMLVEIMGNRVGWLTLYAGVSGSADIVLIPEIPFDINCVVKAAKAAVDKKGYCVIAAAEGALDKEEAAMTKRDRYQKRDERGEITASKRVVEAIEAATGVESRMVVPGHIQRGGNPTPYDRVICTQMGACAAKLAHERIFGVTVARCGGKITHNNLEDIAGKTKYVNADHELIQTARGVGISFGDV